MRSTAADRCVGRYSVDATSVHEPSCVRPCAMLCIACLLWSGGCPAHATSVPVEWRLSRPKILTGRSIVLPGAASPLLTRRPRLLMRPHQGSTLLGRVALHILAAPDAYVPAVTATLTAMLDVTSLCRGTFTFSFVCVAMSRMREAAITWLRAAPGRKPALIDSASPVANFLPALRSDHKLYQSSTVAAPWRACAFHFSRCSCVATPSVGMRTELIFPVAIRHRVHVTWRG